MIQSPSTVLPNLYLGGWCDASDTALLQSHGITHIMPVGKELRADGPFTYCEHKIDIIDSTTQDIMEWLPYTTEWIEEKLYNGHKVFIHCYAGISRSASIVIAYLMWKNDWQYEEAYNFLREKRPIINPNTGFVNQLKKWRERRFM